MFDSDRYTIATENRIGSSGQSSRANDMGHGYAANRRRRSRNCWHRILFLCQASHDIWGLIRDVIPFTSRASFYDFAFPSTCFS